METRQASHDHNKKRKRDKHPMITIQTKQRSKFLLLKNSLNSMNQLSDQFIQPQHPSIKQNDPSTKHIEEHLLVESDKCAELGDITFGDNLSNLITNINDNMCDNSLSINNNNEENEENNEKYKAFVIMNGNTKTIHSQNTINNNKKKITIKNSNNKNEKIDAIIIGECTNKTTCSNDDYTNDNYKLVNNVNNVINEASNLCLNGNNNFKLIGNNVIRTNKIECLINKMGSYTNTNNNPVTNKFSTYYQRNEIIGGILLKSDEIANKYINNSINEKTNNNKCDMIENNIGSGDIDIDDNNTNIIIKTRARARIRIEQQNYKKAKKYCAPSEELTRLQIREDIRKMRNPKMNEIKNILKIIGFNQFINHKAYIKINENDYYSNNSNYSNTDENDNYIYDDDDVQFIGINTKYKKNKKKRNRNNHNHHNNHNESRSNSVFSISSNDNHSNNNNTNKSNNQQPQKKRQKLNTTNNHQDSIKCNQCNKIFTLEVDLLLHKTNDKCC